MKAWVRKHATRLYAVLSAALIVAVHYRPGVPVDAVLTAAGGLLGIGEAAQRVAKAAPKHKR